MPKLTCAPIILKNKSLFFNINALAKPLIPKTGKRLRNRFYKLILFVFESVVNKFSFPLNFFFQLLKIRFIQWKTDRESPLSVFIHITFPRSSKRPVVGLYLFHKDRHIHIVYINMTKTASRIVDNLYIASGSNIRSCTPSNASISFIAAACCF
ncbi:hypothetical protein PAECIP111892_03043 [Paenibacillus auburnensis]|uniref:Uncharacterized protein n=1 Tax=Paenibacillus auburnensis TaxID=2905649 RepID=A0ABN8GFV3_9BACL|nr:hypothetical protein PAECIP111892_03043 [Paenibacillus auburnensis]